MVILMRRLLVFFWSPLLHYCRQKPTSSRKSAKVLSIAHCGMRVAMDIEVIRDHASRACQNFWRAGYDVWEGNLFTIFRRARALSVLHAAAKGDQEGWNDFVTHLPRQESAV